MIVTKDLIGKKVKPSNPGEVVYGGPGPWVWPFEGVGEAEVVGIWTMLSGDKHHLTLVLAEPGTGRLDNCHVERCALVETSTCTYRDGYGVYCPRPQAPGRTWCQEHVDASS